MGKRSDFERVERDFYPTPFGPVVALSPFLKDVDGFGEPCVGDGALVRHLARLGHECRFASDIVPLSGAPAHTIAMDALDIRDTGPDEMAGGPFSHFITNPPWPAVRGRGEPTLGLIRHLAKIRPTWLLLSADFCHNGYAAEVMAYCPLIVSVGRVRWIPDSDNSGKDNAAWYLFDAGYFGPTVFHARGNGEPVYSAEMESLI